MCVCVWGGGGCYSVYLSGCGAYLLQSSVIKLFSAGCYKVQNHYISCGFVETNRLIGRPDTDLPTSSLPALANSNDSHISHRKEGNTFSSLAFTGSRVTVRRNGMCAL